MNTYRTAYIRDTSFSDSPSPVIKLKNSSFGENPKK